MSYYDADIDECTEAMTDPCGMNGVCNNLLMGMFYECMCINGFEQSGDPAMLALTCTGKHIYMHTICGGLGLQITLLHNNHKPCLGMYIYTHACFYYETTKYILYVKDDVESILLFCEKQCPCSLVWLVSGSL